MTVRPPLTPGTLSPMRPVPSQIARPEYVGKKRPQEWRGSHVQTPETIEKMRIAGRLAAQATQLAGEHCKPGVTTDEIDRVVHEFLLRPRGVPVDAGLQGLPEVLLHHPQRGHLPRHPGHHGARRTATSSTST